MELNQLLKECRQQGITAQRYFFDQFASSMFLLCRRYLKNDETAEEIMMNGFLNSLCCKISQKYILYSLCLRPSSPQFAFRLNPAPTQSMIYCIDHSEIK